MEWSVGVVGLFGTFVALVVFLVGFCMRAKVFVLPILMIVFVVVEIFIVAFILSRPFLSLSRLFWCVSMHEIKTWWD